MNFCIHNALRVGYKWWPWLPFSWNWFTSDKNIWMLILHQFHFQFVFGYQLKTARCSSKITNESIVIHGDKSNCAWNIQLKYLRRMANICLFQMMFSQWRPAQIIFAFPKNFFCKGSQHYAHKISRSTDQPFTFFAIFLAISWTNIGSTVFLYFFTFYNFWLP